MKDYLISLFVLLVYYSFTNINKAYGCKVSRNTTPKVTKKEIKYFKWTLTYLSLLRIILKNTIKKGLTNSIGWNLGSKYRSIHLLDPLTSIPIKGTSNKRIIDTNKKIEQITKSVAWEWYHLENDDEKRKLIKGYAKFLLENQWF